MDKPLSTTPLPSTINPILFGTAAQPTAWYPTIRPGLHMISDDDFDDFEEEDDWSDDDLEEEDDDFTEDDEWEDEDELDDDDDDFEEDFDEDFDEDDEEGDDYEYEYRGDQGWDDNTDDDDYSLLGARFASLLDDPEDRPRRFRDREGAPKNEKRAKKPNRRRVTFRDQDDLDDDD